MAVFIQVKDSQGEGYDLVDYEDLRVPLETFNSDLPQRLSTAKSMDCNDLDVIICSYPKSGTHWIANLAYFISSSEKIDDIASFQPSFIEFDTIPVDELQASPRILATHFYEDRLPKNYLKNGGKIVIVLRNPKDVAVSLFYMFRKLKTLNMDSNISWDAYITCVLNGLVMFKSYFDYLDDWQIVIQQYPDQILVVYYEDLKKKCLFEVKRIQKHLGYNHDDEHLKQIIDKCSIGSLRSDVDTGKVKTVLVTEDAKTMLYRKGEIGDWKNHLTVAQNERFDKLIEKRLKKSMFKFQYE